MQEREKKCEVLESLTRQIKQGISRSDNHHEIFNGSYDWHSNVHAHALGFRLLRILRLPIHCCFPDKYQSINDIYSVEKILKVSDDLQSNQQFETPYGRTWLLYFTVELDRYFHFNKTLFNYEFSEEILESFKMVGNLQAKFLFNYLTEKISRFVGEDAEYQNLSFSITQLYDFYSYFQFSEEILVSARDLCANLLSKFDFAKVSFQSDAGPPKFFSVFGNLVHAAQRSELNDILLDILLKSESLGFFESKCLEASLVDVRTRQVHHFGLNCSRLWGLHSIIRFIEENEANYLPHKEVLHKILVQCREGAKLHEKTIFEVNKKMREDKILSDQHKYYAYDHWVPQFIVYATTTHIPNDSASHRQLFYKNYTDLFSSPLRASDVIAKVSARFNRVSDPFWENLIDKNWEKRKAANPMLFNGLKFRLHDFVGATDYKSFTSTNNSKHNSYALVHLSYQYFNMRNHYLSQAIAISVIVELTSGEFLMIHRSNNVGEYPNLFDFIGGHPEPKNIKKGCTFDEITTFGGKAVVKEIFNSARDEIFDEVGIEREYLSEPELYAIIHNFDACGRVCFFFHIRCARTVEEVLECYNNGPNEAFETFSLHAIPRDELLNFPSCGVMHLRNGEIIKREQVTPIAANEIQVFVENKRKI